MSIVNPTRDQLASQHRIEQRAAGLLVVYEARGLDALLTRRPDLAALGVPAITMRALAVQAA